MSLRTLLLVLALCAGCARHNKKSVALYEAGDYAAAAKAADDGLASHPRDEGLWQMRIRAALAQGDADGIAKAYASYRAQRSGDDKELLRDLVVATLGQALSSPAAKIRVAAIEAVAEVELQRLAEQVAERMGDTDDRVAAAAAVAVLRGFPQAPQVAADMLRSDDAEARRIAVDGVGKKIGALALGDLRRAAEDRDPRVRRAAMRWLGQLKDSDAVVVLSKLMRSDADEGVRGAAALALARIGQGDVLAYAKLALADASLAVKLAGIELALAARHPELLAPLLEDPDPMVAAEAAFSTGRSDVAARALERAVAAQSWTVRAGAANIAVRALGKPAAVPVVRKLLADPEIGVRLAAARMLAGAGERAAAIEVFAAALTGDHAVRAAAELADLGDVRGFHALDAAVRDRGRIADLRAQAAAAHRSARRITPGLVAALADPNGVVRVEAAAVIAVLTR